MNTWKDIVAANPDHSENYAARWRAFKEEGRDVDGEGRTIDAMAARGSKILDAGCGTGRIGGYLSERGHQVSGVDIDPVLIGYAKEEYPRGEWMVGDLVEGDKPEGEFDIVVCGGNVLWFIAEDGRVPALKTIRAALAPAGRAVIAFGAGRGYFFHHFFNDCEQAGLRPVHKFATWDLQPFHDRSEYLVCVLERDDHHSVPPTPQIPRLNRA